MDLDKAATARLIAKAYETLSTKKRISDTGEYTGLWGYLHKRQSLTSLKKSEALPNEHKGIITCSKEEYMQLYLKTKRKKSMLAQLPKLDQTTTDLSIDLSKADTGIIDPKIEIINEVYQSGKEVQEDSIKDLKNNLDTQDLKLEGQILNPERKPVKKKLQKERITDEESQSRSKRSIKKKKDKRELDPTARLPSQEVIYYLSSPQAKTPEKSDIPEIPEMNAQEIEQTDAIGSAEALYLNHAAEELDSKNSDKVSHLNDSDLQESNILKSRAVKPEKSRRFAPSSNDTLDNQAVNTQDSQAINSSISQGVQIQGNKSRRFTNLLGNPQKDRNGSCKVLETNEEVNINKTTRFSKSTGATIRGTRNSIAFDKSFSNTDFQVEKNQELNKSRRFSNFTMASGKNTLAPVLQTRRKSIKGDNVTEKKMDKSFNSGSKSMKVLNASFVGKDKEESNFQSDTIAPTPAPIILPLGPARVKELWNWAFWAVLKANKIQSINGTWKKRAPSERMEVKDFEISRDPYDQTYIRKVLQINSFYSKKQELLTDNEITTINSILGSSKFLKNFPQDMRHRLYKEAFLATYPKGKKLIKESNHAELCYILIIGEIIQFSETSVSRVNHLGGLVGGFLSLTPSEPRNYSASCLMRTIVLYFPKQIWLKYIREAKQYEAYQLEALSSLKIFKEVPKSELVRICARGSIRYFHPLKFIINCNETSDLIHFIIKGKVQIMNLFEFVKSADPFIARTYMISAYNGNDINKGDQLVKELSVISELGSGQFFPPILSQNNFSWSYFSGDNNVEVFVITRSDLLEVIPGSLLNELNNCSFFPTRETLTIAQDRYLFTHGWVGSMNELKISERIANEIISRNITYDTYRQIGGS